MRTLETEKVAKDRRLSVGIRFFVAILMHFALGILGRTRGITSQARTCCCSTTGTPHAADCASEAGRGQVLMEDSSEFMACLDLKTNSYDIARCVCNPASTGLCEPKRCAHCKRCTPWGHEG